MSDKILDAITEAVGWLVSIGLLSVIALLIGAVIKVLWVFLWQG